MRLPLCSKLGLWALAYLSFGETGVAAVPRGTLWRVVQTCVVNHQLTGGAFPCLSVDLSRGREAGYAVLRSPLDDVRVIVTPTIRTIGIEAERLRGASAPNYFQDAWASRHFATDGLEAKPGDDQIALAVNSKRGRSQDQLHIHVACVSSSVRANLLRQADAINARSWTRLQVLPNAPKYWAHFESGRDLSGVNVFDLVAAGPGGNQNKMDETTIVVVGTAATTNHLSGFTILARRRIPNSADEPRGEALLDQNCENG